MSFPEISGENLEKEKYDIPSDLEGELNLLIIPFQRWHQNLVDRWATFLNNIEESNENFRYYEIPTLSMAYKIMRFMIDGGMRAGIHDKQIRERTITTYINKNLFKKNLNIKSEETIYLFLIRRDGEIIWRTQGEFDNQKGDELLKIIKELNT